MDKTIVAISTPQGFGAISIVRISGSAALSILREIFVSKNKRKLSTHTIHYGNIFYDNEVIDEVLVSVMLSPNTYTKEDVVEINCHGGDSSAFSVLNAVLNSGAVMASPGEFTKRAFINGRINLSQAEAVIDVINSSNNIARDIALSSLMGSIGNTVTMLQRKLLICIATLEVAIDYPEEGYYNNSNEIINTLNDVIVDIQSIISNSLNYSILKSGINTTILGVPNVGKSSLLNALLKEERAIVTNIAGTTRDIITEHLLIKGIPINIMDTAGIRTTNDVIEKIGQERTLEALQKSDLVLVVTDISKEISEDDKLILKNKGLINKKVIIVANKSDISNNVSVKSLTEFGEVIKISAVTGFGLDDLKEAIANKFPNINVKTELAVANMRHIESLQNALMSLQLACESLEANASEEFVSLDITQGYKYLGEILGNEVNEDIINKIFSEFCLGK